MHYLMLKTFDNSDEALIVSDGVEVGEIEALRSEGILRRTLAGKFPLVESVARYSADDALALTFGVRRKSLVAARRRVGERRASAMASARRS